MSSASIKLYTCFLALIIISAPLHSSAKEMVFVSILPQKYFVQQISGDTLHIEVMVQPGASPATYEPKPSQMRKLASSKAYFAIGVPFENTWLKKIREINPSMKVVHTDQGIEKIHMARHYHGDTDQEDDNHQHSGHVDTHEEHHEEAETGLDPHIWLSPVLVKSQAALMLHSLLEMFPQDAPLYRENYASFMQKLDSLHEELLAQLSEIKGRQFMVFHPSWGYFATEYGLEQIAIEIEGKSPKPAQLQQLIGYARERGITAIFAQSQFSTKNARIIAAELKGEVIVVDPLAEDYITNLKTVGRQLGRAAK